MNLDNENNENLINQEPDFITFGDYPPEQEVEAPEQEVEAPEQEVEAPEQEVEAPEQEVEAPEQEVEAPEQEVEAGTTVDYSQDFLILENIGYFQVFFLGTLTIFFLLWLVCKFFRSFF